MDELELSSVQMFVKLRISTYFIVLDWRLLVLLESQSLNEKKKNKIGQ